MRCSYYFFKQRYFKNQLLIGIENTKNKTAVTFAVMIAAIYFIKFGQFEKQNGLTQKTGG